ncbi:type II secretion system protein F (GspF) [Singulisphaera sp. GP187]|uniref:type II secretion system F family protein n=1 Tax=Singulisphaera sp. GP187 TaxID=1882752 RepID=UPI00092615C5|nr:type II secretion system F family protein [Singulisphaera sp. GP187]SIO63000.1 type II secretion system protein F (GspF) [Singulisphaera sp. GP187]
MSQDPQDPMPRRHPKSPPAAKRPPAKPDDGLEPSTFRANPKKGANGVKSTTSTTTTASEREPMPSAPGLWERILFGRVGSGQLARFCRQFAAYLDAGVDLLKSLSSLETQFARTALGPVIGRIRLAVRQGDSLTEAVAREPQAFDSLFVSLIKVAEMRGGIPETLHRLAKHYEARQSLIRQARSAMIYPIAVLVIASGVVALITIFLLPQFIAMLKDVAHGAALPLPSRLLMAFSAFVGSSGWWMMPLVMIGGPILLFKLYQTKSGKGVMDRIALYIPVLGLLLMKIDTTRFARTLSVLLGSGVDVGTSLDLTAGVLQLDPFRDAVRRARAAVMSGETLTASLDDTRRFSVDVIAIVDSGEETGKLPESLDRLADDYDEQVAYMVKNMGQLVQPILLVILGGIVLFIILAIFLPYLSILTNLAGG